MGSLVEVIAKALVTKPDEVFVTEETDGRDIIVKLKVADEDIGKVIGKSGRIAKAIRTVVKAAAIKQNLRVSVEIVEEDR
ncbi:MAG: KH domain-containing protein [Mogibacterium sp.]|nr:KH domain-containing protein [Mogibacterium sp.]